MILGFDPHADYYSTLGVSESASQDEITKAYRKMALKYHPDRNPGNADAEAKFKQAGEAKEVLTDSRKKRDYDNLRSTTRNGFSGFGSNSFDGFDGGGGGPFGDVFSDFVNAQRRNVGGHWGPPLDTEEGEDINVQLHISLEEAYDGCKKEVVSRSGKLVPCAHCNAEGGEPGTRYIECPNCKGFGKRMNPILGLRGVKCGNCAGSGKVPIQLCRKCHGKRRTHHEKTITVTIPAGVDEGSKLRVSGQGAPGVNAPPGDLMVNIHVTKHPKFDRKESDLYMEHWIPFHVAIRGGDTIVKSVDGRDLKFKVPPNVKSGVTTIRLKGKGMENPMRHTKGDLHVMLEVAMPEPEKMSPKALELFNGLISELENSNEEHES